MKRWKQANSCGRAAKQAEPNHRAVAVREGLVEGPFRTDPALGQLVKLSGPLASSSRRAVYAARMPTYTQAARVGLSWAVDSVFGAVRKQVSGPARPPAAAKED